MKVALVYDRLNSWGGAERLLLALHRLFPAAPLYTSVYDSGRTSWAKSFPEIRTSFLQKIVFFRRHHRLIPFLMPFAFCCFNFSGYDLVISVTSEFAKCLKVSYPTKHICICLTPTRYLWSGFADYFPNKFFRLMIYPLVYLLRCFDKLIAQLPWKMIAISSAIKKRIWIYYGRDAVIIHPPLTLKKIPKIKNFRIKSYFLIVSRLVPYKKIDLAIKVFNQLQLPLIIIGEGPEEKRLKRKARKNIRFNKNLTDAQLGRYYQNAKALIVPQNEDFGLAAVEAQSYGVPVIAYNRGGIKDVVTDGVTGVFFNEQSVESMSIALKKFMRLKFNRNLISARAGKFSETEFRKKMRLLINYG